MTALSLMERSCPVCQVRRSRVVYESNVDTDKLDPFAFASRKIPEYMHHRLVECSLCTLLYADPAPAPGALATLYHEADYDSKAEATLAARTYAKLLPDIRQRLSEPLAALDVGTGSGE